MILQRDFPEYERLIAARINGALRMRDFWQYEPAVDMPRGQEHERMRFMPPPYLAPLPAEAQLEERFEIQIFRHPENPDWRVFNLAFARSNPACHTLYNNLLNCPVLDGVHISKGEGADDIALVISAPTMRDGIAQINQALPPEQQILLADLERGSDTPDTRTR